MFLRHYLVLASLGLRVHSRGQHGSRPGELIHLVVSSDSCKVLPWEIIEVEPFQLDGPQRVHCWRIPSPPQTLT